MINIKNSDEDARRAADRAAAEQLQSMSSGSSTLHQSPQTHHSESSASKIEKEILSETQQWESPMSQYNLSINASNRNLRAIEPWKKKRRSIGKPCVSFLLSFII